MVAHCGHIDPVWQLELRIKADVGVLRRDVLFRKVFQCHARNLRTIKAYSTHVDFAFTGGTSGISLHGNVMRAAEKVQQHAGRVLVLLDLVKVNGQKAGDLSRESLQADLFTP